MVRMSDRADAQATNFNATGAGGVLGGERAKTPGTTSSELFLLRHSSPVASGLDDGRLHASPLDALLDLPDVKRRDGVWRS